MKHEQLYGSTMAQYLRAAHTSNHMNHKIQY